MLLPKHMLLRNISEGYPNIEILIAEYCGAIHNNCIHHLDDSTST